MVKNPQDVTDAELGVLRVLWGRGASTIREIVDELYPGGSTTHYATVQKLLERLEAKHCVTRKRGGTAHVFRAKIERRDLIGKRLQDVADSLCEGSVTPLITQLVAGQQLTAKQRRALSDLVDELDKKGRR